MMTSEMTVWDVTIRRRDINMMVTEPNEVVLAVFRPIVPVIRAFRLWRHHD